MNIKINISFTLITIVFVILKLLNVIDWSWWIVFIPLYVAAAILIFKLFIVLLLLLLLYAVEGEFHDHYNI